MCQPFFCQLLKIDSTFIQKQLSKNGSFVYKVLKALKIKELAVMDFASPAKVGGVLAFACHCIHCSLNFVEIAFIRFVCKHVSIHSLTRNFQP